MADIKADGKPALLHDVFNPFKWISERLDRYSDSVQPHIQDLFRALKETVPPCFDILRLLAIFVS